ncbi:hypothetical protein BTJ40_15320 [Microbulbifer sp. A4B17]|uniref:hypothetical protein n=1 Tax=Microbulbifer sp. A4B17 TaxID=359370 RepID=UPI000D52F154|nr:hypothetical protein [Microbulbifer sp. A4B17]AWF82089.1 hypothetical protein BTJ40_15320 [Microbulbifer sp. A4B17]
MAMPPAAALNLMTTNTSNFLKTYPVRIWGNTGASAVRQYCIGNGGNSYRPGTVLGTHNMHTTEAFQIRGSMFYMATNPHLFFTHSIHMDAGAANLGFYRLPPATGPSIMVTGQLSACSFVIRPVVGSTALDVAHIRPAGISGTVLRNNLSATYGTAFVYGTSDQRGFYNGANRTVSVIGIRTGTNWKIYAQKHDRTTGDYRIMSVYMIYPSHQKM